MESTETTRRDLERVRLYAEMFPDRDFTGEEKALFESDWARLSKSTAGGRILREIETAAEAGADRLEQRVFFGNPVSRPLDRIRAAACAFAGGKMSASDRSRILTLFRDALLWCSRESSGPDLIFHGTGSHALEGIVRTGHIVPGGDGLTGEVSISGVIEYASCVIWNGHPAVEYFPYTYSHMCTHFDPGRLAVNADRLGNLTLSEICWILFLRDDLEAIASGIPGEPGVPEWDRWLRACRMLPNSNTPAYRFRTLRGEREFAKAYIRILRMLKDDSFTPEDIQPEKDRTLKNTSAETATTNFFFEAVRAFNGDGRDYITDFDEFRHFASQLARERYLRLLAPVPGDDKGEHSRKLTLLRRLQRQYPCLIAVDADACRLVEAPDRPSFERLVDEPIPVEKIRWVSVPETNIGDARRLCASLPGFDAKIIPMEFFEVRRAVSELFFPAATPLTTRVAAMRDL